MQGCLSFTSGSLASTPRVRVCVREESGRRSPRGAAGEEAPRPLRLRGSAHRSPSSSLMVAFDGEGGYPGGAPTRAVGGRAASPMDRRVTPSCQSDVRSRPRFSRRLRPPSRSASAGVIKRQFRTAGRRDLILARARLAEGTSGGPGLGLRNDLGQVSQHVVGLALRSLPNPCPPPASSRIRIGYGLRALTPFDLPSSRRKRQRHSVTARSYERTGTSPRRGPHSSNQASAVNATEPE